MRKHAFHDLVLLVMDVEEDPVDLIENFLLNHVDKNNEYHYREKIKSMPYEDTTSLTIDFEDFYKFHPSLARELIENPNKILLAANQAIAKRLSDVCGIPPYQLG